MARFTLTHEINCDAETFWKLFFDQEFNKAMFLKGMHFPAWSVLSQTDGERELVRKIQATPKVDLPGPVAKLMGSNFSFVEEGTLDKGTKVWRWKMIPSTMADKLKNEGTMRIEPVGTDKVKRIAELTIEAKVFGLGGIIESSAEKGLREGWEASAKYFNKHLAEQK